MPLPSNIAQSFLNERIRPPHISNRVIQSPDRRRVFIAPIQTPVRLHARRIVGQFEEPHFISDFALEHKALEDRHLLRRFCKGDEERV